MTAQRFAPIIRVSTEKQAAKGQSLETQTNQIQAYVHALGGTIPSHCWKYKGQESATPDKERALLNQLLQDSGKGLFDAVIVVDPSRWSRDNLKSKEGLQILRENGIRFFVGTTEFDLHDPTQNMFLGISAEVNEFSASIGALKSIQNRIARAKKGIPVAGKMPYGRIYDKATGKWSIDAEKQRIIQQAAQRYIDGENIADIAASLGFVRSTLYQTLIYKSGPEWTQRFRYAKAKIDESVTIQIPELLPPDTIKQVQQRKELNTNSVRGNRKWFFLLSGFVFCGKCGHRFMVFRNQNGNKYYRHRKNSHNKTCQVHKTIKSHELENAVLLQMLHTIGDVERVEASIKRAQPDLGRISTLQAERETIQSNLRGLKQRKTNLIDAIADGILDKGEAKSKLEELRTQETAANERLATIETETEALPDPVRIKTISKLAVGVSRSLSRNPKLIFKKDDAWKRRFIEKVFSGTDPSGRPLGIYVKLVDGKWTYEARAGVMNTVRNLELTDMDLIEFFNLDSDYQDVKQELEKIRSNLASSYQTDLIYTIEDTI